MVKFTTNDRMAASFDGKLEQVPWSAECSQYTTVDGIRIPLKNGFECSYKFAR